MTFLLIISVLINLYFVYRNHKPNDWVLVAREQGTYKNYIREVGLTRDLPFFVELYYSKSRNKYKVECTENITNLESGATYARIMKIKMKLQNNEKV